MENIGTLKIGRLSLMAPFSWQFMDLKNNFILARKINSKGILQLSTAFRKDVAISSTKEDILKLAFEYAGISNLSKAIDSIFNRNDKTIYGSFSTLQEEETNRFWYYLNETGLLIAVYKITSINNQASSLSDLLECNEIIKSMRFED